MINNINNIKYNINNYKKLHKEPNKIDSLTHPHLSHPYHTGQGQKQATKPLERMQTKSTTEVEILNHGDDLRSPAYHISTDTPPSTKPPRHLMTSQQLMRYL